jgi:hypothetical protein
MLGIILSLCCFTLLAQDSSGTSDTSTNPDTGSYNDSSGSNGSNPSDTSMLPDTSQNQDTSGGLESIKYSDTCDTSDSSGHSDSTDTTEIPDTAGSYHQIEYSDTSDTSTIPDTSKNPDSTGSSGEVLNTSDENPVVADTVVTETYIESDGSGKEYKAPSGMYLGVGIGAFYNLRQDNPAYQAFIGRMWSAGNYLGVTLEGEGATDFHNTWFVDGILRFDLYPLPTYTAISPFIGIGAGIGWATKTNLHDDALGVNLNGTVGLRILKNWPVGLTLEANVDWLLNKVVSSGNPVVLMGRVGITF